MLLDSTCALDLVRSYYTGIRVQQILLDSAKAVDLVLGYVVDDSSPADAAGLGWWFDAVRSNCGRNSSPTDPAGLS